jgi:hypothetical protein
LPRGFRLVDFVSATSSDDLLLHSELIVSADARLQTRFVPDDDGWAADATRLKMASGFPCDDAVGPWTAAIVTALGEPRRLAMCCVTRVWNTSPRSTPQRTTPSRSCDAS